MNKDPFGQSQIKGFPHSRGWQKMGAYQAIGIEDNTLVIRFQQFFQDLWG
jgi:hypothetical protein